MTGINMGPHFVISCLTHTLFMGMGNIAGTLGYTHATVLPPKQVAELLPWYMQWSRDLADEMHRRHLVRDKAHHTDSFSSSYHNCGCTSEWQCEPYDACFIHDSCFCPGSGSFP